MKFEGQKKNYLKIGVEENIKYFSKVNLDPWFLRKQKSLLKHISSMFIMLF